MKTHEQQFNNTVDQVKEFLEEVGDIRKRCDMNTQYISDREQVWGRFQKEVIEELRKMNEILKPMAETYNLISKFSNLTKQGIVGFSVLLGIIATISGIFWGWFEFFRHK
jgi:hypothetical protein